MANGGVVKLHPDQVMLRVRETSDKVLGGIALQIERQTKINIQGNGQIDTGFMLNSVYTVSKFANTYGQALPSGAYASQKSGGSVQRVLCPQQTLPGDASAACAVGANYSIFQEVRKSFLYAAAEAVAIQVRGNIDGTYKDSLQ